MPWQALERDGKWCVYKLDGDEPTGDVLGCHDTKDEAEAQVAALYANENKAAELDDLYAVKALGRNRIGGYLVLWGDEKRRDLSGEWFTPQTEGLLSVFRAVGKVPLL
ncbi:MAG: hypothetical protein WC977_10465, partial [Anaerovoracaceae bacterium]